MLNIIDENTFKSKIQQKDKKRSRNAEVHQVLNTFFTVMAEKFNDIYRLNKIISEQEVDLFIDQAYELKQFVNLAMIDIRNRYKMVAPIISDDWNITTKP